MNALKGRNILITGSTGFIDANLVRRFIRIGAEVYILTRIMLNKRNFGKVKKNFMTSIVSAKNYRQILFQRLMSIGDIKC